jgi:hypothetical protein
MRPVPIASTLALITSLLGCQLQAGAPQHEINAGGRCNASAVSHLVGETADPATLDQARTQSGAETARIVRPDQMITQEYNERRLTLSTDEKLKIQRVRCG